MAELLKSERGYPADVSPARSASSSAASHRNVPFILFRREMALTLLVPVALYLWFVHHDAVNAVYYDQWENVALLTHTAFGFHSYAGHTSVAMLWQQHNENRTFFPNLLVLTFGSWTHLNVVLEEYFSAALLIASAGLLVWRHQSDSTTAPWIAYLPVMFLMLTLGQFGDTLFGFQMAWYLAFFCMALSLCLLDTTQRSWLTFVGALGAAVIGSYSSLQGLFIWPAGLVVIVLGVRTRSRIAIWIAAAVATTAVYCYRFDFSAQDAAGAHGYFLAHLWSALEYFLVAIGDISGSALGGTSTGSDPRIVTLGAAVLVLAAASLAVYARTPRLVRSPLGPALMCFGLLFALSLAAGRSYQGLPSASQSRYVTFDLLVLVGAYLCLLDGWNGRRPASVHNRSGNRDASGQQPVVVYRSVAPTLTVTIMVMIGMVFAGWLNGLTNGNGMKQNQKEAALIMVHAKAAPNSLISSVLFPNASGSPGQIRELAQAAQEHHLSVFATSEAAQLTRLGLPRSPHPIPFTSTLMGPRRGAVLHGRALLWAEVTDEFEIRSLRFEIERSGAWEPIFIEGKPSLIGWLGVWRTSGLGNGYYTMRSVASDQRGDLVYSPSVTVEVAN